jgi:hypothetical protein
MPRATGGAFAIDVFEHRGGMALVTRDDGEARLLVRILGELQHAAGIPHEVVAVPLKRAEMLSA